MIKHVIIGMAAILLCFVIYRAVDKQPHFKAVAPPMKAILPQEPKVFVNASVLALGQALKDRKINEEAGNNRLSELSETYSDGFVASLVRMIQDSGTSERWRNYCVQHIASFHLKYNDAESYSWIKIFAESDSKELVEISLFSLARIANETKSSIERSAYADSVFYLRQNLKETRHVSLQTAAVRATALIGAHDFDEYLTVLLKKESTELSLRVAAIDAIGVLQIQDLENDLYGLRNSKSEKIRFATERALSKMRSLDSVLGANERNSNNLRVTLRSSYRQIRHQSVIALLKVDDADSCLPEVVESLQKCDLNSSEDEIVAHLNYFRKLEKRADVAGPVLVSLLDERSSLYQDRNKDTVQSLRAYILVTLSDIKQVKNAPNYIADSLANYENEVQFAAAAYACKTIGEDAKVFVPLLAKGLDVSCANQDLSLNGYKVKYSGAHRTSMALETLRALQSIGPSAREAIPAIHKLLLDKGDATDFSELLKSQAKATLVCIEGVKK